MGFYMKRRWGICALLVMVTLPFLSNAASSEAENLAIESYRHLVSYESLLDGAIRSGDRRDYQRFIEKPTRDMAARWPQLGNKEFDRYMRCAFALHAFVNYSEDQFKAAGKLPKDFVSAKDYFEQKNLCKKSLKGGV